MLASECSSLLPGRWVRLRRLFRSVAEITGPVVIIRAAVVGRFAGRMRGSLFLVQSPALLLRGLARRTKIVLRQPLRPFRVLTRFLGSHTNQTTRLLH